MADHPPALTAGNALFLDFDGTLVDIVPTPDQVQVTEAVKEAIWRVAGALDGAVAIVTGRTIEDVSARLGIENLAIYGSHGAQRRLPGGNVEQPDEAVRSVAASIRNALTERLADSYPELLIEAKAWSAALHYRARPDLEPLCIATIEDVAGDFPEWEVMRGDMLVEARLAGISKASAVSELMDSAPFRGRVPVFIGDDVTDEDGIREAQGRGGYGIKVGRDESIAAYRLDGPVAVLDYLCGVDLTSRR